MRVTLPVTVSARLAFAFEDECARRGVAARAAIIEALRAWLGSAAPLEGEQLPPPPDPGVVAAVTRLLASGQASVTDVVRELGRPRNRGLEMAIAAELRRQGAVRVRTSRGHVYRATGALPQRLPAGGPEEPPAQREEQGGRGAHRAASYAAVAASCASEARSHAASVSSLGLAS